MNIQQLFVITVTDNLLPLAVTCSEQLSPDNGQVLYAAAVMLAPFDFGTAATYLCDLGYGLVGDTMSRCGSDGSSPNGEWSGIVPACLGNLYSYL